MLKVIEREIQVTPTFLKPCASPMTINVDFCRVKHA